MRMSRRSRRRSQGLKPQRKRVAFNGVAKSAPFQNYRRLRRLFDPAGKALNRKGREEIPQRDARNIEAGQSELLR